MSLMFYLQEQPTLLTDLMTILVLPVLSVKLTTSLSLSAPTLLLSNM
jgi:hypothetical protein